MNVFCTSNPCPVILNSTCVFYEGANLFYTGINTNDSVQTALEKIDSAFGEGVTSYIFNNGLIKLAGDSVQLGGELIKNTTIGGSYKLTFVGNLQANSFIKTAGTNQQFLLADGSVDSTLYTTLATLQNEITNKEFIQLIDVPNSYTGQTGKILIVNPTEDALVFTDLPQSNVIVVPNTGLLFEDSELSTIYNTTIADNVNSVPVGGAPATAASVWKTKTIVGVLDTILFPTLLPTYTVPTITISGTQSGIKEVGVALTQSLTLGGIKNDAGPFTLLNIVRGATLIATTSSPTQSSEPNVADQFGYPNPNNPNYRYTLIYNDSYTIALGNNSWSGNGTYLGNQIPSIGYGLPKKDNKGVFDTRPPLVLSVNAPQLGTSNYISNTVTVTGIYPYFYYKSSSPITASGMVAAIQDGLATKVVASSAGTLAIPYNLSAQYLAVAYPASSTIKTVYFVTTLDSGAIELVFDPVVTQNVNSATGLWSGISYRIHTSKEAITNSNTTIELRNL